MKSKYWAILLGLILSICLGLSLFFAADRGPAHRARITSNGEVFMIVDLSVDQEYTVSSPDGDINVITVKNGKIAVTHANCPDGYCMDRGFCNSGPQIVCLPNRVAIQFLGENEIDGMLG